MKQEMICPLLTTNTVVDENNTVKIGTQPVLCVQEQCSWWIEDNTPVAVERNLYKTLYEQLLDRMTVR